MSDETAFEVGRLYPPIKAIADVMTGSMKDIFVRLPALVAYYPMGIRAAGNVYEHGGSGITMTQTGVCPVGYDGNAFTHLGNGTNYVKSASGLFDITGLETWVTSSIRGLTRGGWFMIDSTPASQGGLITKFGAITEYGYAIYAQSAAVLFNVSSNGSALFTVSSASNVALGQWHFIAARFIPGTEIAVFVDGDKSANAAAIPVSINISAQDLEVGRYLAEDSRVLHAKARDVFVCAAALSDALIEEIRVTSVP